MVPFLIRLLLFSPPVLVIHLSIVGKVWSHVRWVYGKCFENLTYQIDTINGVYFEEFWMYALQVFFLDMKAIGSCGWINGLSISLGVSYEFWLAYVSYWCTRYEIWMLLAMRFKFICSDGIWDNKLLFWHVSTGLFFFSCFMWAV